MHKKIKNNQILVLTSGGIDSTACINYYIEQKYAVESLFVDYGQLSRRKEAIYSRMISRYYKIPYNCIRVHGLGDLKHGFIIGRNLLLLSTALINFKRRSGLISLGIHTGTNYYDCSREFIDKFSIILDNYSNGQIKLDTPFINLTKRDIWNYCLGHNVPLKITYSCENGLDQPCGNCLSCKDLEKMYASTK